jgi:hypothetical protein
MPLLTKEFDPKEINRHYLFKIQIFKIIFYPFLILLDKLNLLPLLRNTIDYILPKIGFKKSLHTFFQYQDYYRWFKNDFIDSKKYEKILLIPSMLGANSNLTMMNLLFSRYFMDKGYKPVFLICDAAVPICNREGPIKSRKKNPFFCHECWQGFKAIQKDTGVEVIYFSDLFDKELKEIYESEIINIEGLSTLEECLDYSFSETRLGLITKKSVLRYFLRGRFYNEIQEISKFKMFLKSSLKLYLIIRKYFNDQNGIDKVIVNNGTLAFESLVRHFAEKYSIDYMTYETFIGNNSIIYKKNAEVMNLDWEKEWTLYRQNFKITEEVKQSVENFFANQKSGKELYARMNVEHDNKRLFGIGRYACLFTNLNFDTAVIDKHTIFTSMEDWINEVIEFWEKNVEEVKLVIRIHPAELKLVTATKEFMGDRISDKIKSDKIILFDSHEKVSSYELISKMEYGLVYSSTIGLEIAYRGLPCVVAGKPYYRKKGFVIAPDSKEKYFQIIEELNVKNFKAAINRDEIISLIYYLYFVRTKRLNGLKVWTPQAETNSIYSSYSEIFEENKIFFDEFYKELFNREI